MRTKGIIRPVDKNGRVVIPMELRKLMDVENDADSFEIFMEGDSIIMRKYQPSCIFCGEAGDTLRLRGHNVCMDCISVLQKMKESIL